MKTSAKRFFKTLLPLFLAVTMLAGLLVGCAGKDTGNGSHPDDGYNYFDPAEVAGAELYSKSDKDGDAEEPSDAFVENPFIDTARQNVSTFSADVDTASYALFRKTVAGWVRQKANKQTILSALEKNASLFRTEEFLNYFRYEANAPKDGELFGTTVGLLPCPWNEKNQLLRLTLQAPATTPTGGNNLVFLIDVSGSMSTEDKLPLLKTAFTYLVNQLTERDVVSIVTYSGEEKVVLQGCAGNERQKILDAVNSLTARGATNGEAGLKTAYKLAADYRIANGNNRIIMASDGDLNVGISSADELKTFIEGKRDEGTFLSILGFGSGNYRDNTMETLADNGNGVYYYIDGESEAQKVFGADLISTLYTVAKDVKLQLTFDPTYIASYRQIGYENRQLSREDFTDDTKDAGEVGAGHQVTVFYELVMTENGQKTELAAETEFMKLAVRYKAPDGDVSKEDTYSIGVSDRTAPDSDTEFMFCVLELTMLLHSSKYLPADNSVTYETVLAKLRGLDLASHSDRAEFRSLVEAFAG
ncbi:MAG TPA: VWA domain-containing protein [Clostridiales bacterium]|nr:VWA domain-containing protein [Clostridiales bacterium]